MAADNGAEIDLYDNIEEDFDSSELTELYDDVIAPPSSESTNHNEVSRILLPEVLKTKPNLATPNASHTGRRIATYVGNLTWWTTDVDLYTAFNNLGITDILEIKFHENRQNGQSKGFCVIVFGSEQSVRTAMEKLSKIEINGQTPVITYCTKHNLSLFEKAAGGEGLLMSNPLGILPSGLQQNQGSGLIPPAFGLGGGATTSLAGANAHINPNFFQQGASSNASQAGTGGHAALPNPLLQAPQLGASALRPQLDQFGRPLVHTYTPSQSGKLNDSEFEDILQRNKTVSSSAINRAVQDAASGDYASAIETLVTAISLIKQSKIASDDRCKILINSLQDTLHGIESKSYGSKSNSSRRRRRSYSDSGSECNDSYAGNSAGGGGSSSRRRGDRDRSRRSRSRDRHRNDDRHRRSRDRDHDSRSSRDYYSQSGMNSLTTSVSPPRTGSISSDRRSYHNNRVLKYVHTIDGARMLDYVYIVTRILMFKINTVLSIIPFI
ncbi:Cleavage and polyadenylation specificity factor subunit 6 [Sparganum proliferum]